MGRRGHREKNSTGWGVGAGTVGGTRPPGEAGERGPRSPRKVRPSGERERGEERAEAVGAGGRSRRRDAAGSTPHPQYGAHPGSLATAPTAVASDHTIEGAAKTTTQ